MMQAGLLRAAPGLPDEFRMTQATVTIATLCFGPPRGSAGLKAAPVRRSTLRVVALAWLWASLLGLLTSCAGHAARTMGARSALDAMQPQTALSLLNEQLEVDSAEEVPTDVGGDNVLLLLDRAMVLQQLDQYDLASRDLELADKSVQILDFSRTALDDIGKYVFSDSTGPYKAPAYEKLMINTINMINYLVRGDLNGARVEARRLAVMQKYLKDHEDPAKALLGPGSYLAGFIFEKSGRPQEALRYYDEALQYGEYRSLEEPIRRLAQQASYRTPRIRRVLGEPAQSAPPTGSSDGTGSESSESGSASRAAPESSVLVLLNRQQASQLLRLSRTREASYWRSLASVGFRPSSPGECPSDWRSPMPVASSVQPTAPQPTAWRFRAWSLGSTTRTWASRGAPTPNPCSRWTSSGSCSRVFSR
jgi:tetratricopeptide (TPR) repeat protein